MTTVSESEQDVVDVGVLSAILEANATQNFVTIKHSRETIKHFLDFID